MKLRRRASAAVLLAALILLTAWPAVAPASTYVVNFCSGHKALGGLAGPPFSIHDNCLNSAAALTVEEKNTGGTVPAFANSQIVLGGFSVNNLPSLLFHIQQLDLDAEFSPEWPKSTLNWSVASASGSGSRNLEFLGAGGQAPETRHYSFGEFDDDVDAFDVFMRCENSGGCGKSPDVSYTLRNVNVTMADESPPVIVQASGSLLQPGKVQGPVSATVKGVDIGAGIYDSALIVDNQVVSFQLAGGSNCQKPFEVLIPCQRERSFAYEDFDTTTLADGHHTGEIVVCDATDFNCDHEPFQIDVENAPKNLVKPAIAEATKPGSPWTADRGKWEEQSGSKADFAVQWLRCPAKTTGPGDCSDISGSAGDRYVPTSADVGSRLMVKETATLQAAGHAGAAAFSEPSATIQAPSTGTSSGAPTAPALTGVSLTHKRFKIAPRKAAKARKGAHGGTVLRFTASVPGKLTIKISSVGKHRKPRPAGTLTATAKSGANRVPLSGRIGKAKRPLRPGSYRLAVTLTDAAGHASAAVSRPFTILP